MAENRFFHARHAINAIPTCDGSANSVTPALRHVAGTSIICEERALMVLLGSRLAGPARDYYYRNLCTYNSIEGLINDFRQRFGDITDVATALNKLKNEQMLINDNLSSFSNRLDAAIAQAKNCVDNQDYSDQNSRRNYYALIESTAVRHFLD